MRRYKYNRTKISFYADVLNGTKLGKFLTGELKYLAKQDTDHALQYSRILLGVISRHQGYKIQVM